jgi:hypothetical protein
VNLSATAILGFDRLLKQRPPINCENKLRWCDKASLGDFKN